MFFPDFSFHINDYICFVRLTVAFLVATFGLAAFAPPELKKYILFGQAQGTTYQVIYYATDSVITSREVDSILLKIDSSLSLYKPYSLINRFNESRTGISVDEHFLAVIRKSLSTYKDTDGIFDVTVQPLVQAWGFGTTKRNGTPGSNSIASI